MLFGCAKAAIGRKEKAAKRETERKPFLGQQTSPPVWLGENEARNLVTELYYQQA